MRLVLAVFFLAAVLSGSGAAADAPRKIDFTVAILDQDNEPMVECTDPATVAPLDPSCKAKQPITLGAIAMRSLAALEQGIAAEESLKRGQLALLVYKSHGAELTVEEIALIKKRLAVFYSPLVVVRAFALLDPAAK